MKTIIAFATLNFMAFSLIGQPEKTLYSFLSKFHKDFLKDEIIPKVETLKQLTDHQIAVGCALINKEKPGEAAELAESIMSVSEIILLTKNVSQKVADQNPNLIELRNDMQNIIERLFSKKYQKELDAHKNCKECNTGQLEDLIGDACNQQ